MTMKELCNNCGNKLCKCKECRGKIEFYIKGENNHKCSFDENLTECRKFVKNKITN